MLPMILKLALLSAMPSAWAWPSWMYENSITLTTAEGHLTFSSENNETVQGPGRDMLARWILDLRSKAPVALEELTEKDNDGGYLVTSSPANRASSLARLLERYSASLARIVECRLEMAKWKGPGWGPEPCTESFGGRAPVAGILTYTQPRYFLFGERVQRSRWVLIPGIASTEYDLKPRYVRDNREAAARLAEYFPELDLSEVDWNTAGVASTNSLVRSLSNLIHSNDIKVERVYTGMYMTSTGMMFAP